MDEKREAAVHFTQYLCGRGIVTRDDHTVSKDRVKEVFKNEYQPQYAVRCLDIQSLTAALAKAGMVSKQRSPDNLEFRWTKLEQQGFDSRQIPVSVPSRLTKPKPRIIISQRFFLKEHYERSNEGIITDKCKICNLKFESDYDRRNHESDELHILRSKYRSSKKEFEDNRNKMLVWVEGEDQLTSDIAVRVGQKQVLVLGFKNNLEHAIQLEKIIALISHKGIELEDLMPCNLPPGEKKTVSLKIQLNGRSAILYPLVFKFKKAEANEPEYFLKDLIFRVQSELMDNLKPIAPYRPPAGPITKFKDGAILPGVPPKLMDSDLRNTLDIKDNFEIPAHLLRFLNNGFRALENMTKLEEAHLDRVNNLLSENPSDTRSLLSQQNYAELFQLMLYMEEHQMNKDIHNYDMRDVVLQRPKDINAVGLLTLEVPGLAEKRPSLLINDSILVNYVGDHSMNFEGKVNRLSDTKVFLGFHSKFYNEYNGEKVQVRFTISRNNLRNMHLGLVLLKLNRSESALFPSKRSKPPTQPPLRPWFNKCIESNPEQQKAVRSIVWQSSQNSPYLIFGPPGTGKTVTMVETILQLWEPSDKKRHILVCAPSNTAADVITERLLPMMSQRAQPVNDHLIRLYAASRPWRLVPPSIQNAHCTNHNEATGDVFFPRKEVIMQYNIVVTTFCTAARLVRAEIPQGHFSHILMDEVGQAMEPEALIPISGLATSSDCPGTLRSSIVMAGDPKQLGPILQSPLATKFGLDKSLLERLMDLELYQKMAKPGEVGGILDYDSNVLTKLVRNYRSHEVLLHVANELFYDNELKAKADSREVNTAVSWHGLPKKDFPLIFHGVEGYDEREGNSPSYFNRQEIELVVEYIEKLLKDRIASAQDIGVVTPYSKQVKKLQRALMLKRIQNHERVMVGSVEQFQGQERKVIIISTVRSRLELLPEDYMYQLGFLKNPKRFNVAVTRARTLLIVVGNPNVLQHDRCWLKLLKYCIDNDSYRGIPFSLSEILGS